PVHGRLFGEKAAVVLRAQPDAVSQVLARERHPRPGGLLLGDLDLAALGLAVLGVGLLQALTLAAVLALAGVGGALACAVPPVLFMPNAWDVASARIVEQAGFPAVATSSAGVANVLGYPDGERISRAEMLDMIRRISAAVGVPVTADMEAGYGTTAEAAAETARGGGSAGACGA